MLVSYVTSYSRDLIMKEGFWHLLKRDLHSVVLKSRYRFDGHVRHYHLHFENGEHYVGEKERYNPETK